MKNERRRPDVGRAVGQGERHFLNGGRARLADVIATDRNRVPFRSPVAAEGEDVRNDAQRRLGRIDVSPARDVFLQDVVLNGAGKSAEVRPLLLRHRKIEGQQDRRRGVDGHRRGHAVERNRPEQGLHVLERVDGHSHPAHLAAGERVIGVKADLGGQIEGHREAGLALLKQVTKARVRLERRAVAGVLAHGPEPAAVKRRIDAARERVLAGKTQLDFGIPAGQIFGFVQGPHLQSVSGT
jgi:hypothetical protein